MTLVLYLCMQQNEPTKDLVLKFPDGDTPRPIWESTTTECWDLGVLRTLA